MIRLIVMALGPLVVAAVAYHVIVAIAHGIAQSVGLA